MGSSSSAALTDNLPKTPADKETQKRIHQVVTCISNHDVATALDVIDKSTNIHNANDPDFDCCMIHSLALWEHEIVGALIDKGVLRNCVHVNLDVNNFSYLNSWVNFQKELNFGTRLLYKCVLAKHDWLADTTRYQPTPLPVFQVLLSRSYRPVDQEQECLFEWILTYHSNLLHGEHGLPLVKFIVTSLNISDKALTVFSYVLKNNLSDEYINLLSSTLDLIRNRDSHGNTVLHLLASFGKTHHISEMLSGSNSQKYLCYNKSGNSPYGMSLNIPTAELFRNAFFPSGNFAPDIPLPNFNEQQYDCTFCSHHEISLKKFEQHLYFRHVLGKNDSHLFLKLPNVAKLIMSKADYKTMLALSQTCAIFSNFLLDEDVWISIIHQWNSRDFCHYCKIFYNATENHDRACTVHTMKPVCHKLGDSYSSYWEYPCCRGSVHNKKGCQVSAHEPGYDHVIRVYTKTSFVAKYKEIKSMKDANNYGRFKIFY